MNSRCTYLLLILFTAVSLFPACDLLDEPMDEDSRELFTGDWNCREYLNGKLQMNYTVTISKDPSDPSQIILHNFAFIGTDEKPPFGVVNGESVVIPTQQVCYDESITIKGTGEYISKNETHWEYTVEVGGDMFTYTAVFERIHL
ncbi:MAG: hypothetical protein PHD61_00165 [Bacteroidales bacterium]|nr:hypothetical protein [Lentimicrobiaceae bacterium]MDD5693707.1 hypothetical protein [Bacteroidales bacterium]